MHWPRVLLAPLLHDAATVTRALDILASDSFALEQIDVAVVDSTARKHHAMRVESCGGDGRGARRVAHAEVAHVRLEAGEVLEAGVVDADGVVCAAGREDGRVLMDGKGAQVAWLVWVAR